VSEIGCDACRYCGINSVGIFCFVEVVLLPLLITSLRKAVTALIYYVKKVVSYWLPVLEKGDFVSFQLW